MMRINTVLKSGRVHTLMWRGKWITITYTYNAEGGTAHVSSTYSDTLQAAGDLHLTEAQRMEKMSCQKEDTSAETPSE